MKTRRLGRTGLEVSELAFGGGWVGGILIHQNDEIRRAALSRSVAAGINLIDTAPSYGEGRSESALGRLLPEVDGEPWLATKVKLEAGTPDDAAGQVERSITASLERLRRTSVDILQLHNPIATVEDARHLSADRVMGEVADALDAIREQGLTRFIGITGLGEAAAVRRVVGSGRFDTAQVYYNLLNPSAGQSMPDAWDGHDFAGVLAACRAADVGVLNIRAFAGGVIASDRRHGREIPVTDDADLDREARRATAAFDVLGREHGTRAQMAVRFSLANQDISAVVVGMAEPAHLEEAVAAAARGPLPASALAELRALYAENFHLAG